MKLQLLLICVLALFLIGCAEKSMDDTTDDTMQDDMEEDAAEETTEPEVEEIGSELDDLTIDDEFNDADLDSLATDLEDLDY